MQEQKFSVYYRTTGSGSEWTDWSLEKDDLTKEQAKKVAEDLEIHLGAQFSGDSRDCQTILVPEREDESFLVYSHIVSTLFNGTTDLYAENEEDYINFQGDLNDFIEENYPDHYAYAVDAEESSQFGRPDLGGYLPGDVVKVTFRIETLPF